MRLLVREALLAAAIMAAGAILGVAWATTFPPAPEVRTYGPPTAFCYHAGIGHMCKDVPHSQDI